MTSVPLISFKLDGVDLGTRPLAFAFSIAIDGKTCWPMANDDAAPVEIQIDDLFGYLVEFWRPLMLRQNYPFGLTPLRPSHIARAAERHWENQPEYLVDEEAGVLTAFEEAHDLSRAFGGLFDLPHFWMLREGDRMLCDTGRDFWRLPFDTVAAALADMGDWIARYLIEVSPEKWDRVVEAWTQRDVIDSVEIVAWSAGVATEVAETLIDRGVIVPPGTFADAANDNDPLLIAARMAGELPAEQIIRILDIAKSFGAHEAPRLDEISARCIEVISGLPEYVPPHAQGEAIAREVRGWFNLAPQDGIDIFALVGELGIEVRSEAVEPRTFDGLAIAGGHYGPGAFLNEASRRLGKEPAPLSKNGGARVTLAHELCHLLVDRGHALSAVEVLRSRMPSGIEARAKAFAGELLLPTSAAAYAWQLAGSPLESEELELLLQELVDRFGVTFSVAAWKVEHGAGADRNHLRAALDGIAPYR